MDSAEVLDDVVRRAAAAVEALGVRLEAVYIFGSQSSRTAGPDSDIDLTLVSEAFDPGALDIWRRVARACHRVDPRIEAVLYTPGGFRDEEPLAWEIKRTGRRVDLH